MDLCPFMLSCPERADVLRATLADFARTDFLEQPIVELDDAAGPASLARITAAWRRLLGRAEARARGFFLLMEDDLHFNHHLMHNLARWPVLASASPDLPFFGSLYDPGHPILWRDEAARYRVAPPEAIWGSQALVVSSASLRFFLRHWDELEPLAADVRMGRLCERISPVFLHAPSLVQQRPVASTWGPGRHAAADFDPVWRAP